MIARVNVSTRFKAAARMVSVYGYGVPKNRIVPSQIVHYSLGRHHASLHKDTDTASIAPQDARSHILIAAHGSEVSNVNR